MRCGSSPGHLPVGVGHRVGRSRSGPSHGQQIRRDLWARRPRSLETERPLVSSARMDRPGPARGRHRPGAGHGRGAEGRQRPPRHRDEPGARGVPALPAGDAARPRRSRLGRAGTGSCCRAGTPASPCTSSSTSPATASSWTTSRRCAPGAAGPRATRSTATPPASRPPPARSARASATRSAWRWRPAASAACSTPTPPRARAPSTTTSTCIASDGDLEEGVSAEASSLAGHQQLGNLIADLRRQPDLHRGRHRRSRSARTSSARYERLRLARAGRRLDQRRHRATSRTSRRCGEAIAGGQRGHRPAELHQPAHDHRLAGARTRRTPARPTAPRSAPTRSRPPRRSSASTPAQTFEVARRGARAHPRRWSTAAAPPRPSGRSASTPGRRGQPRARRRCSTGCAPAPCPPAGTTRCRRSTADAKGVATRKASGEVLSALAPVLPELWGGSADLAESNNTTLKGEPSFIPEEHSDQGVHRATATAASCTSASASTPWARS